MTDTARALTAAFEASEAGARAWIERMTSELEFAEGLCRLHPKQSKAWHRLMSDAAAIVERIAGRPSESALAEAIERAEAKLRPLAKVAKTYTVHCVGHAHIDMNWMWSWPETVAVTNDTFATVLRLMDEYPGFRFSQSQASVYAIIERYNPEMLKEIARRVREGRWEVTASHWVECDKNMVGGEALARHILYTRRHMKKLLGLEPEDVPVDWSPDTFGHAATVPNYLVRGAVKYLYLHRPGVHGPKRPSAFWWKGTDGSRVLVKNDMELGYNGVITPDIARCLAQFARETGCRDSIFVYGVGDHGGGPTRRDVLRAIEMDRWPVFPNVRFSTAREFFRRLESSAGRGLPTLDFELNTEFTGCYTSQSLIKKANRYAESRLVDAECASALAWAVLGRRYPAGEFTEGWRDALFSHFHDILPGSGVHDTRTYAHGIYQRIMASTGMAETLALRDLAAGVDTSRLAKAGVADSPAALVASGLGAGVGFGSSDGRMSGAEQGPGQGDRPFVVFNLTQWKRCEVVEATVWDNAPRGARKPLKERRFEVRLPGEGGVAAQMVASGHYWGHEYVTLAFPVEAAGLGYSTCVVAESDGPALQTKQPVAEGARLTGPTHHCRYALYECSPEGLENELVRVVLDPSTGGIRSLTDKKTGQSIISSAKAEPLLQFAVERPHGMTAWSLDHTGPVEHPTVTSFARRLGGPHKASVEFGLRVRESDLTLTYELRANDPCLYVHVRGTWFERGTRETGVPVLRAAFPLALRDAVARYEIPFGAVERRLNSGEETPALRWARVRGRARRGYAGCLLINDSKHGHSLDGGTLRLTLIRSSYDPDPLPEIGAHEVHLGLVPFGGQMTDAEAIRLAGGFSSALRVVGTGVHEGPLPGSSQLASLSPGNVILSALKKAEDDDALVARLYEVSGRRTVARLRVNEDLLGKLLKATEVDLVERAVGKPGSRVSRDSATVGVPGHGISSVLVELRGARARR